MYFIYNKNQPNHPATDIHGNPAIFKTKNEAIVTARYWNIGRQYNPYLVWQMEGGKIMPQTYYKYTSEDGEEFIVTVDHDNITSFFINLSKRICFSDCSNELVTEIYFEGQPIYYGGWKPNMLYTFYDEANNLVWAQDFPHWDH